ncbi:MAG: LPXTG cell wall anchor domain-containing protein [Anaerolineae bacterium]|nr:LPXTG cell wall anchor domain-containing protein [Anaerolineae bacterium]
MSDYQDSYEEFDEQPSDDGGGNNRNFLIAIVAVIVVFLVIVAGIAGFFFLSRNSGSATAKNALAMTQAAMIYTQNAQTAAAATQAIGTQQALALLPSETPAPAEGGPTSVVVFPTDTPAPTIVVAQAAETSGTPAEGIGGPAGDEATSVAQRTATISALLTQVASGDTGSGTLVAAAALTPTALPETGFMDEVGLPVLMGMAVLLIFIIFMARRLRASASR